MLPQEFPLTSKEHAQWMLHRLVPNRGICNLAMALRVERHLRWWPLQEALAHLLSRHQTLRTVLRTGGAPLKTFLPPGEPCPLTTEPATEETAPGLLTALAAEPLDLAGPLVRAHLLLLPSASIVCVVMHHLVADYSSSATLLRELARLYDSFAATGRPPEDLAGPAPTYPDEEPSPDALKYWLEHLAEANPGGMAMAGARAVTGRPTFAGGQLRRCMSAEAFAALRSLKDHTGATDNIVLLAAFYLLLARHGAGPDLVVGVPVTGQPGPPTSVGFHAVTLPIRVMVEDDLDATALIRRVRDAFMGGVMHGSTSFEAMQRSLATRSGEWRAPLFRHMFNFRPPGRGTSVTIGGEAVTVTEVYHGMSRLDVEFVLWPHRDGVRITARYSTEVHDAGFATRLLERYDAVVTGMATALDRPIATVTGLAPVDVRAATRRNATRRDMPSGTVLAGVRHRAAAAPGAPAMRADGRTTTYGALMARAEWVRTALARRGAGPGDTVALHAARGPALAAAVLGVWATGAAYLPLDPAHPDSRVAGYIEDCGAGWVLADGRPGPARLAGRPCLPISRRGHWPEPPPALPWATPPADHLAYVICTSGSTGKPKGVEVSHGSLANLVWDFAARLAATPDDRTLWQTTFSFDISALELLLPLLTGGTAVVARDEDRLDPARLLALIASEDATILQATPTGWRHVAHELSGQLRGRRVLCGGEPLDARLATRLLADGCRLFNVYGPTETTIWSTVAELREPVHDPVPIGEPIANTSVHVLCPQGRPVAPGVPGELCIGGAGLAAGYRGLPTLTAQCFVADPALGRYYRTGDQVRESNGEIAFVGRLDRQVKVRGHRVELTEVESVLGGHPEVRAAAAFTEPDGADGLRLVAAIQMAATARSDMAGAGIDGSGGCTVYGDESTAGEAPGNGTADLQARLHAYAAERLPPGAVPSRYVLMDVLPTTGNGKVDLASLTARLSDGSTRTALPTDPVLARLVLLWRELLCDDRLGLDSHFFLCGGHSLLAGQLAERIAREFHITVAFDAIFDAPSPAAFHAWLAAHEEAPTA